MYLDDILVMGITEEAHLRALEEVLSRLERAGLQVKRNKFMKSSVTYLYIDVEDLHTLDEQVRAIVDAPAPNSASKSFWGMVSYYSKFLQNLSSILHPLYRLLKKNAQWEWRADQAKAIAASKELLISSNCLTHFDSELDISLPFSGM